MTQAQQVATQEKDVPDDKEQKEEFYMEVPRRIWYWSPTEDYLMSEGLFPKTSYAAGLVMIRALRGVRPALLLVQQNPDDPEKFYQQKGPVHTRPDEWKCPIGRFTRDRYLDKDKKGILDNTVWDTFREECWWEELGIDLARAGKTEEESQRILANLKNAPVLEDRILSRRHGSVYHIDRIHFFVTPRLFRPNKKIWKYQIELRRVRYFYLDELPRKDLNGHGSSMCYSHVRRLVEFFEDPRSEDIRWQAGIPDDISEKIRMRFPKYDIPKALHAH